MLLDKNLTKVCRDKNLSITDLARLSGIRQSTLHGWSTGRSVQKIGDLKKVCQVLQVSLHFIIFGYPDPWHETKSETVNPPQ